MEELIFNAMDVLKEVKKLLDKSKEDVCEGMTDSEQIGYNYGVLNTLSALQVLLELDEEPTVHVPQLDGIIEMDMKELEEIFLK